MTTTSPGSTSASTKEHSSDPHHTAHVDLIIYWTKLTTIFSTFLLGTDQFQVMHKDQNDIPDHTGKHAHSSDHWIHQ